jgi:ABC-type multidrug transport system ATPase subunit
MNIINMYIQGKSTLLDLMAFRKLSTEGSSVRGFSFVSSLALASLWLVVQVHLNGRLIAASEMHKISNFVEQEDALLGVLTVRESVAYALRLQ